MLSIKKGLYIIVPIFIYEHIVRICNFDENIRFVYWFTKLSNILNDIFIIIGSILAHGSSFITRFNQFFRNLIYEIYITFCELFSPIWNFCTSWLSILSGFSQTANTYTEPFYVYIGAIILTIIFIFYRKKLISLLSNY